MRHRRGSSDCLLLLTLLAVTLLGSACTSAAAGGGRVNVGMKDNFYTREVTRVDVGDTVRFTNDGQVQHNAVAADGAWSTGLADGDDLGGLMEPGDATSLTFTEPGVTTYYCTLHGTDDGQGMAATLVVGDVDYQAAGGDAPAEPVTEWTETTRRVDPEVDPGGTEDAYPTVQGAVDAAEPGDLVLIEPGVYSEEVQVTTPYLTLRGTDRNEVVIDGEFQRPNAISVFAADGVAVENLTVRGATENGLFWTGLRGYRASHVTAINNGVYGIYAFDATDGLFEHSLASGSPDAGFYIGQCDPCEAVIDDVVAERNALGYSGTNASGVFILNSVWRDNIAGIVPNTLDSELLPPFTDVHVAGNLVHDNDRRDTPALEIEWPAFGNGIVLAGGLDSVVERNLVVNHERNGIVVTPNLSQNFWMSGDNVVRDNDVHGSGYADLTLTGPALEGNCFSGNGDATTAPVGLQAFSGCAGGFQPPLRTDLAPLMATVGLVAEVELGLKPEVDYRTLADPAPQAGLPGGADAPVRPAVDVFASVDLDLAAVRTPSLPTDLTVDQSEEFTVAGVPLAAGAASLFFDLYGYLLPFVLLASWVAVAFWDIARRDELSRGAAVAWVAVILLVPFVGPVLYHAFSRSPIPAWLRATIVGGGLLAYVLILGVGLVLGGVV